MVRKKKVEPETTQTPQNGLTKAHDLADFIHRQSEHIQRGVVTLLLTDGRVASFTVGCDLQTDILGLLEAGKATAVTQMVLPHVPGYLNELNQRSRIVRQSGLVTPTGAPAPAMSQSLGAEP